MGVVDGCIIGAVGPGDARVDAAEGVVRLSIRGGSVAVGRQVGGEYALREEVLRDGVLDGRLSGFGCDGVD